VDAFLDLFTIYKYKKKPTYLERFISYQRRELSARAAFFFVDGGSIN
jgi:hypothetical protein